MPFKKSLTDLNNKILNFAKHPKAFWIFGLVAFLSGSFLPLPIDPLFIVLCIQNPNQIFRLSLVGTFCVTLGGLLMYGIGRLLYCTAGVWIINLYSWQDQFAFLKSQLDIWGGTLILIKTFTPIPYKLLALAAGMGGMKISVFLAASLLGRFARLLIEGLLLRFISPPLKEVLQRNLSVGLGFFLLALLLLTFLIPFLTKLFM